jgi:hypothetical protein
MEYNGYYTHITHFKNTAFRPHSIYVACHFLTTNSHCAPSTVNRLPLVTGKQRSTISPEYEGTRAKLSLTTLRRYIGGEEVWLQSLTLTLGGGKWPTSGFGQLTPPETAPGTIE